jgi:hypothetical protein
MAGLNVRNAITGLFIVLLLLFTSLGGLCVLKWYQERKRRQRIRESVRGELAAEELGRHRLALEEI